MSRNLPTWWSGNASFGKFWLPIGLCLFWGVLLAGPVDSVRSAATFAAINLPAILFGSFLFFVPGQLRSLDGEVVYRRWINWQTLQERDVSEIRRAFGFLGILKLSSGRRLFFFIEPENRSLLGRDPSNFGTAQLANNNLHLQYRGALVSDLLLFILGAIIDSLRLLLTPSTSFWSMPRLPLSPSGSSVGTFIGSLITSYQWVLALAFGIIIALRVSRLAGWPRRAAFVALGWATVEILEGIVELVRTL
jgi:hypothetical protein